MRSTYLLLSSFVLSSLSSVVHGTKPTFLKKQPGKSVLDVPRGGGSPFPAGPFSADLAQKIFVGTYGMNAAICAISPSLGTRLYGIAGEPDVKYHMQGVGVTGMTHALLLYLQVFKGMSYEQAMGWSIWPFTIRAFYQGVIAKNGDLVHVSASSHVLPMILNLVVFFASQTEASWAGSLNKFYGYFSLVNALMYFFPEEVAKAWKISLKSDETKLMLETMGYFLFAHGISVVVGASSGVADAIGWTALAVCASLAGLLLRGELKIVKQELVYPWMLLLALVANSLLSGQR